MRKIVVLSFISLDGVMQAPGGPDEDVDSGFKYGGWTVPYSDEVFGGMMVEQMSMPFDLLLGRKTYSMWSDYWPKNENGPIGASFKKAKKYVVSSDSDLGLPWQKASLISGDVVAKLKSLKAEDGPMLQVQGSANLAQTLFKHDLVDELWLKTFPVLLGNGKKLFAEGTIPAAFELIETKTTPSGVIFASYKRGGEVKTGSF
ncbi:MAG: dihydrofolate reductase family protein [Candidatus Saccharibacteria bacterium]|nr:dihydrofolate reductase family protein [Candidatus Saccharibacteria bacterium]